LKQTFQWSELFDLKLFAVIVLKETECANKQGETNMIEQTENIKDNKDNLTTNIPPLKCMYIECLLLMGVMYGLI
jgi:hypothetical protein